MTHTIPARSADQARRTLHGLGASSGCAVGAVRQVSKRIELPPDETPAADPARTREEIAALFEDIARDLEHRAERMSGEVREVLEATALIARDPTLLGSIEHHLACTGPANAIHRAVGETVDALSALGDYWAERATDLNDVRDRAIARWLGVAEPGVPELAEPAVLVALDLAPADVAALDRERVLGVITELGGPTAHMAIVTSQLGIPCIVRAPGATAIPEGTQVAMDGGSGEVIIAPSGADEAAVQRRIARQQRLRATSCGPGLLADGARVALYANVGTVADAIHAAGTDVEGVGLFRTEFLYGDRDTEPSVAEQTANYSAVLQAFGDRPVTFRTLDVGADKPLPFLAQPPEANPALGVRGLRHSQRDVEVFERQLQALAAAHRAGGTLRVMAPMVATAEEAAWFAARCASHGLDQVGVMIEVPSAALRSRQVLAPVDFGSLGTNDLGQYVMAADRTIGDLAQLLTIWQPAVLDLVAASVSGAADKPIGVCGEAAGDPLMALVLVGLGVASLSMAESKVAAVRYALSLHTRAECVEIARCAVAADGPELARQAASEASHPDLADLL